MHVIVPHHVSTDTKHNMINILCCLFMLDVQDVHEVVMEVMEQNPKLFDQLEAKLKGRKVTHYVIEELGA